MRCASSIVVALFAAGCGYSSQYTAPADGRARVLWNDDHLANNLASLPRSPECHQATWWQRHPAEQPPERRLSVTPMVWVPVYYGADIVVTTPGVLPILPRPVLFSPSLAVAQAVSHATPRLSGGKELMAVLLLVAVVVLPIVDVTFAALRPESDTRSAEAIDEVNAYNDLQRSGGNPCSP